MEKMKRYDRLLFAMCGLAGLLYGIDMGLIAAALPYIKATCGFTEAQLSGIVAVNTGAMLRERGVSFLLSADSHAADTIDCAFDRFAGREDFCAPEFARRM